MLFIEFYASEEPLLPSIRLYTTGIDKLAEYCNSLSFFPYKLTNNCCEKGYVLVDAMMNEITIIRLRCYTCLTCVLYI